MKPSKRSKADVLRNVEGMYEFARRHKTIDGTREGYYYLRGAKDALRIALNAVGTKYDHSLYTSDNRWATTPDEVHDAIVRQLEMELNAGCTVARDFEVLELSHKRESEESE